MHIKTQEFIDKANALDALADRIGQPFRELMGALTDIRREAAELRMDFMDVMTVEEPAVWGQLNELDEKFAAIEYRLPRLHAEARHVQSILAEIDRELPRIVDVQE